MQNKQKIFNKSTRDVRLISVLILLSILLFSISRSYILENLSLLDGPFQTYNYMKRIDSGQLPGSGYQPYLGVGLIYFIYPFYYLFGSNFAASLFASYLLCQSAFVFTCWVLLRLSGTVNSTALKGAAIFYGMCMLLFKIDPGNPILHLLTPANSLMSLRALLPIATVAILYPLWRQDRFFIQGHTHIFRPLILTGLLCGAAPFWSNDFGLSTSVAIAFVLVIFSHQWLPEHNKPLVLATALLVPILTFILILFLITSGKPELWIDYNFQDVAKDQFWYFPVYENKFLHISQLSRILFPQPPSFTIIPNYTFFVVLSIAVIVLVYLFRRAVFTKSFSFQSCSAILTISIANVISAIVCQIGSWIGFRYSAGVALLSYFLPIYVINGLFINNTGLSRFIKGNYKLNTLLQFSLSWIAIILLTSFSIYTLNTLYNNYNVYIAGGNAQYVTELGLYLSNTYADDIELARRIDKAIIPIAESNPVTSEYSSIIDAIGSRIHPFGFDYLIHALGSERDKYLNNIRTRPTTFAVTINPDSTPWAAWSMRLNWWFHREIYKHYSLIEKTDHSLLWKFNKANDIPTYKPSSFDCRISDDGQGSYLLQIYETSADKKDITQLLNVSLNYEISGDIRFIKTGIIRQLLLLKEIQSGYSGAIGYMDNRQYGLPTYTTTWDIPLQHKADSVSLLKLSLIPAGGKTLILHGCTATEIATDSSLLPGTF